MKRIIGFTDSVTECECCGKTDLKGTFCLEIDGVELYYGSTCAFKSHGLTTDEQKMMKARFSSRQKAEKQFQEMELNNNGTPHYLVKMLRFVQSKKLDLMSFILKYGTLHSDAKYYTAYSIGHEVVMIDKP
jgi:hypothetical protein